MLVLALVLYALWLLLGFSVRVAIQRRRTGDSGVRGFGGVAYSAAWWASLLLVVAHVGGVVAPVVGLLGLGALPGLDNLPVQRTGLGIVIAGIVASVVAQLSMGDSWRIGVEKRELSTLVTTGPFRVVRNPIFSSVALTMTGFVLLVGNPAIIAIFVALIVALQLQVRTIEEPYLRRTHGPSYREYAAKVGRFVPGIGRLRPEHG